MNPSINEHNRELDVHFVFHNVGQGLFHSGQIGSFNFIYDCGVTQKRLINLRWIIHAYKYSKVDDYNRKFYLDLLILSHLHADHVSGLKDLFEVKVEVNTVILPYLTPIERLMVVLQAGTVQDWLYDFWADPVTFLIEQGVKRVVLIGGEKGTSPPDTKKEYRPPPKVEPDSESVPFRTEYDSLNYGSMPDDNELKTEVLNNDPKLEKFINQNKLLIKNHNKNLTLSGVWVFRLFNYKPVDTNQEKFEACIKKNCDTSDLKSVIKNKPLLDSLKSCYKILWGDFNNTSIVVYHGPINIPHKLENLTYKPTSMSNSFSQNWLFFNYELKEPSYYRNKCQIGHFLTGDINLNVKWDEISKHFGKFFSNMGVVLLPHHGSLKNWNFSLLYKLFPNTTIWVASAGINNRYGHPHFDLMNEIKLYAIPFYCNEVHGLRIYCRLEL